MGLFYNIKKDFDADDHQIPNDTIIKLDIKGQSQLMFCPI